MLQAPSSSFPTFLKPRRLTHEPPLPDLSCPFEVCEMFLLRSAADPYVLV